MKKILIVFLLSNVMSWSQTKNEVESLLKEINQIDNSTKIGLTNSFIKISAYHKKVLPLLSDFFSDTTITSVYSDCNKRNLKKGEIAIIVADQIDRMPYFILTKIQNCTLDFCPNNSNFIEYYFNAIPSLATFQSDYKIYLNSNEFKKRKKR